jgi:excinuclease UvrABC nuclease subunit
MMEDWDRAIKAYKKQLKELMYAKPCDFKAVRKRDIPSVSGVYVIFDKAGVLLYVGQSSRLRGRLIDDHLQNDKIGSAFRRNLSECYHLNTEKEITQYILDNCFFKYMELDKPKFLEHFAISLLKPKLNK